MDTGKARIDRANSKLRWYKVITEGLNGITDVHSMQGAQGIFGRWNLFQELFKKILDTKMKILLDKYTLEYTEMLGITLDNTYKYND